MLILYLIFKIVSEYYIERKVFLNNEILVAILALVGTLSGTFGGILTSSRLTAYRIQQLEEKVDKHNNFAQRVPLIEEKIKVINHRIEKLEGDK